MEKVIKFSGWTPSPNTVTIGMERDNKVFSLKFDGLPEYPNGTVYLHIDCGENGADSIEVVDGAAEIKRNVTQYEGEKEAYVEILADGDVVWHSDVIMVTVKRLPILGKKIEQEYPTAFEQALAQTAADKAAAAKSAADAAATAAGIVTEEAARQDAESKRVAAETARGKAEETRAEHERLREDAENERVKAENAREAAEANREQAEAAREKEVADALSSVAGVENTVQANEQQRVLAERTRAAQEQARQSAEQSRVEAEQARAQAEQRRDTAETARADAESKRVQAEQGRVTAEQGRVEAEAQREETMAQHAEKIAKLEAEVAKKAEIDDTTVSNTEAWSSQHIVDMLCPPLEASGNPVVCYPVANSNLDIVASWEPTQDGTGTPYPAGGGPNLLDISQCTATIGTPYGLTLTIDGDIIKASGVPSSEVTEEGQYSFAVASCAQTELRGKGYKVTAFAIKGKISNAWGLRTEDESSLAISAKLTPGVDTDIQFRLMVSKDTPAAYAPYANIRPIHGRTQVKVERCGANLLNIAPFTKLINQGITYEYVANGGIHISGTATSTVDGPTFAVGHLPPGKYYGLYVGAGVVASIVVQRNGANQWLNAKGVFEILAGDVIKYWYMLVTNGATLDTTVYPYIVPGTSAPATSAPYIGSTTTLTLPSSIYGGEVGAGEEGQETWKLLTLDGTEAWAKYGNTIEESGSSCFYLSIDDKDIGFGTSICNQFSNTKNSDPFYNVNMKKFTYTDHPSIKNIYMNYGDDQTVTVDEWKAYLAAQHAAGTPVQIAYKIATSVPFAATGGGVIKALSGTNTVLTDADTLTVTGRADPIHIIQQLQAASAASTQAIADVERAVTDI